MWKVPESSKRNKSDHVVNNFFFFRVFLDMSSKLHNFVAFSKNRVKKKALSVSLSRLNETSFLVIFRQGRKWVEQFTIYFVLKHSSSGA